MRKVNLILFCASLLAVTFINTVNADSTNFTVPNLNASPLSKVDNADVSDQGVVNYDTSSNDLVLRDGQRIHIPPSSEGGSDGGANFPIDPIDIGSEEGWQGGDVVEDWQLFTKTCGAIRYDNCYWSGSTLRCTGQMGEVRMFVGKQHYMKKLDDGSLIPVATRKCTAIHTISRTYWGFNNKDMRYDTTNKYPDVVDKNGKNWGNYYFSYPCPVAANSGSNMPTLASQQCTEWN